MSERWCVRCEVRLALSSIPVLFQGQPTGGAMPAWTCECGYVDLIIGCPTCADYCAICGRMTCHCGEH
jgi:hypothetical protein